MKKQAFTLAEVLITLAIIGVVAAISIPSVVANTQQKEFQTGLRKAVSVLNSAITMNMAIDGESPYENGSLYNYLGRHMSIMKTRAMAPVAAGAAYSNAAFYTTDGMRFEFPPRTDLNSMPTFRDTNRHLRAGATAYRADENGRLIGGTVDTPAKFSVTDNNSFCGSYGMENNPDNNLTVPCYIVVDVNGDRKPFPKNASCFSLYTWSCPSSEKSKNVRKYSDPTGVKLTDTFGILITDKQAIPYGVAAQRAMYQAQAKEK